MALLKAVDGGLDAAVSRAGGELTGYSVKFGYEDCLMVLKAVFPAGPMVAFVGAGDASGCYLKATREAGSDSLQWRQDKWAGGTIDEGGSQE
jgi:hypothetical protein